MRLAGRSVRPFANFCDSTSSHRVMLYHKPLPSLADHSKNVGSYLLRYKFYELDSTGPCSTANNQSFDWVQARNETFE
jgi:hypothetical protein